MRGDGDGWVECGHGHRHWGRFGAAGLLLRAYGADGTPHLLMQHRAAWSHHGGTWGLAGGARDSHETPDAAALREAYEEASIEVALVEVRGDHVDDHDGWSYTTVIADALAPLPVIAQRESLELRWVPERSVGELPLHPGFAASWPRLGAEPVVLVVDAANVVGSRPDGWWRDRAGATDRLLASLAPLRRRTARLPSGRYATLAAVVVVVEGGARSVAGRDGLHVVRARGEGDDAVVAAATGDVPPGAGLRPLVVTADRGLRSRLPEGAAVVGPRWLLGLASA